MTEAARRTEEAKVTGRTTSGRCTLCAHYAAQPNVELQDIDTRTSTHCNEEVVCRLETHWQSPTTAVLIFSITIDDATASM